MAIDIGGGSLFWTSGIRTSGLRRDSKVIQGEFAKLGASGGKLGRLLSPKVLGLAGLVIGLEQVGEAAFKFSKEFESAFAQVKTISAQSVEGFEEMERAVLDMTTVIPVNAIEASEALYQIVSAGIDGADAMLLLEVASRAAIAGVTEVETAADGLTTIINAFSLEASDAEDVAAALFTTVKLGKTTFGELSSSVAQAASIAANSGISFQELLAAITTLTKSGVPTVQAVTQVRSAILAVTEVLGDGAFAGRTMQEAFIAVRDASNGSNTELRVMLGRVEALNAVLGLTGAKAQSAADDLNAIRTETENANEAFDVMVQTTENQFRLLGNNIKESFLKPVGDALVKIGKDIAGGINLAFGSDVQSKIQQSADKVNTLVSELVDANTEEERRFEILTKLKQIAPEVVKGINAEKVEIDKLTKSLIQFNAEKAEELLFEESNKNIKALSGDIEDLSADIGKNNAIIAKEIGRLYGIAAQDLEQLAKAQDILAGKPFLDPKSLEFIKDPTGLDKIKQLNRLIGGQGLEFEVTGAGGKVLRLTDELAKKQDELNKALEAEGVIRENIGKRFESLLTEAIPSDEKDIKDFADRLQQAISSPSITNDLRLQLKQIFDDLPKPELPVKPIIDEVDLNKLKKQFKEAIDKGDIEEATEIKVRINIEEDNINLALDKVENILTKRAADITSKGIIKTIDAKGVEKARRGFEVIKGQVKVIAGKIKEIDTGLSPIPDKTQSLGSQLGDAAQSMNDLATFAGTFDGELAESIQKIAGIASGLGTILDAGGNPFKIFSGGLQILTSLFGGVDEEQEKIDRRTERIRSTIQAQNILLERQISLLNELSGIDRTTGEADVLALIDRQVKEIDELAISMGLLVNQTTAWGSGLNQIDVTGIEDLIEQLQGFLANNDVGLINLFGGVDFTVQNLTEVQDLIDEYNALIDRRRELLEELVQTSSQGIADVLAQGFAEGKNSIEDFAGTFEDLMKDAIIQSFKTQTLLTASKGFFDEFAELSRGGLTAQEIETLRNSFSTIINTASEQFTALNDIFNQAFGGDIFGGVTDQADSLAGQIGRSINEDTAIELVGLWTRTSFDVRLQVELQQDMVTIQTDIASNTLRTAEACEDLNSKIAESNQSDRDTGNNLG